MAPRLGIGTADESGPGAASVPDVRLFSVEQRRARLAGRHGLAPRVSDPLAAAEAMTVLHATDPATVYLSALARMVEPDLEAVAAALYHDRSLVRVLAMRRTLFVVPRALLETVERSSTDAVAATERARLAGFLRDSDVTDPDGWLAAAAEEVVAVLAETGSRGEGLPARRITAAVPRLGTKIHMGVGTRNPVTAGATSRVLAVLANEGLLVRGRPTGTWTNRTYEWFLRSAWLGADGAGSGPAPPVPAIGEPDLDGWSAALLRRWLVTFGPAPLGDLVWWTGWTKTRVRAALARLDETGSGAVEVEVEVEVDQGTGATTTGLVLADDLEDDPEPGPWVALLPALDPTPMGWKARAWYLGGHEGPLFDRNGNIGPTVWADGRIVGGWAQTADGTVVVRLLEDVGADHEARIEAEAARLTALLDGTAVKPSFPTPLQKELAAG